MELAKMIRDVPDFPKEGIIFKDITTLTKQPQAFREAVDMLADHYADQEIDLVVAVATPITLLFPEGTFDTIKSPILVAVVLIGAVSFLIGLALRTDTGRRLGGWLEDKILDRLPVYAVLKRLVGGFSQAKRQGTFRPALLTYQPSTRRTARIGPACSSRTAAELSRAAS